jgi:hypothetical protein
MAEQCGRYTVGMEALQCSRSGLPDRAECRCRRSTFERTTPVQKCIHKRLPIPREVDPFDERFS